MKLPSCGSSSVSCLYTWWIPLWFFVTTRGEFDYWGIPCSMISLADIHQILPYLGYHKSMSEEAPSHLCWCTGCRHFVKAPRKGQICDFPKRVGVVERPSYKGPACCMHWALGGWGTYWSNKRPQGDSPSPGGAPGSTFPCDTPWRLWNNMISSPVGRDD